MPKKKEVKSDKKAVWECQYFTVFEQKQLKKGKEKLYYTVERPNPNTVHVVAITEDDKVILVEQFRPAVNRNVLELPAGICDKPGESLPDVAKRELLEETGYTAEEFELIFSATVSPGITNELYNLFLAMPAKKVRKGGGVHGEDIKVLEMPRRRLIEFIIETCLEGDVFVDAKIPTALALVQKYLDPEAFF